jgi:cob(I)alamin adenosyltransferase
MAHAPAASKQQRSCVRLARLSARNCAIERRMKIYTKTGDRGETGLFGGARVSKASTRVSAYGDVDELNSVLGLVCAHVQDETRLAELRRIQCDLFVLGAELAKNPGKDVDLGMSLIAEADVERLERSIDACDQVLAPLKTFILPGGDMAAAFLHLARTTCRRAERWVVALSQAESVRPELVRYLNRLSDLLFTLARAENQRANVADVPWIGREGAQ